MTASVSSSSLSSWLFVTSSARGRSIANESTTVIVEVSITETRLSASSATNSLRPVGDSASATGSAPTSTVASTAGVPLSMFATRLTVPVARFAT